MKKNKELKEANQKLQTMSEDEYMQRIADLREKAILDERSNLYAAKSEGFSQGLEQGINQGIKQGIDQGIKQGIKQGSIKTQLEIAKKMLKKGIDIDTIIEITNLSKEEILIK